MLATKLVLVKGLEFRGLGFRGFRGLGFRGLGFRVRLCFAALDASGGDSLLSQAYGLGCGSSA